MLWFPGVNKFYFFRDVFRFGNKEKTYLSIKIETIMVDFIKIYGEILTLNFDDICHCVFYI